MKISHVAAAALLTAGVLAAVLLASGAITKAPTRSNEATAGAARTGSVPDGTSSATARIHTFEVSVPAVENPALAIPHEVALGDTVVFLVSSERPGKVAVHGLGGEVDVGPSTVARLTLTPGSTGRFPLHFHGNDGAHIAVSAIDVYPKD